MRSARRCARHTPSTSAAPVDQRQRPRLLHRLGHRGTGTYRRRYGLEDHNPAIGGCSVAMASAPTDNNYTFNGEKLSASTPRAPGGANTGRRYLGFGFTFILIPVPAPVNLNFSSSGAAGCLHHQRLQSQLVPRWSRCSGADRQQRRPRCNRQQTASRSLARTSPLCFTVSEAADRAPASPATSPFPKRRQWHVEI